VKINVVYLIDRPGVGKYTVAKELQRACDNQLINSPSYLELLNYDSYTAILKLAWQVIEQIRDDVFAFLTAYSQQDCASINCLANTKHDRQLYQKVQTAIKLLFSGV